MRKNRIKRTALHDGQLADVQENLRDQNQVPAPQPPPPPDPSSQILELLQKVSRQNEDTLDRLDDLAIRVENLENQPPRMTPATPAVLPRSPQPAGDAHATDTTLRTFGLIMSDPDEGIPDAAYRDQHTVIIGRRTKDEVREAREKLYEQAYKERERRLV